MMIAGANTPAMIKTMTTEVESRNLIAASSHPYADSFHTGMPPRPRGPCIAPSRFIEPLHARRHDWQRSSSRIAPTTGKRKRRHAPKKAKMKS
jgi:hypothetical protein